MQAPRFYFFDMGVSNYLLKRTQLHPGTPEYGHAFEQFVATELIAYIGYNHKRTTLSYWHTYTGQEVDFIIGDAEIAIEVKSAEEIQRKHLAGLKSFQDEHPECRLIVVSRDIFNRQQGEIELLYIRDFLQKLWAGELF